MKHYTPFFKSSQKYCSLALQMQMCTVKTIWFQVGI